MSKNKADVPPPMVPSWYPPGADSRPDEGGEERSTFGNQFETHFHVPRRIASKDTELIETVNDFHFAMMNDHPRNEFYYQSLKAVIKPTTVVVEIGTGSGMLAMIAAQLGAKHVTAIEANKSLAEVARRNMESNGLSDRVTIVNKMSTDCTVADLKYGKADVLVSEILGTLLLSESALEYNDDARKRLVKPRAHVIPLRGAQHVTLVESERLDVITTARNWRGLDFSAFNALKDTSSLLFTKQMGCRVSTLGHRNMSPRIAIISCDFGNGSCDMPKSLERRIRTTAMHTGTVHAAIFSWEVSGDRAGKEQMTTHMEDVADNFPRDMQWGQGVQMLEDHVASEKSATPACVPLRVTKGEVLELVIRYATDGVVIQCLVERVDDNGDAIGFDEPDGEDADEGSSCEDGDSGVPDFKDQCTLDTDSGDDSDSR